MEKITATLASIPTRIASLYETISSLIGQVDEIQVYLNNYRHIPEYLYHHKINIIESEEAFGDLGDAGKFYNCENITGYHFTCDDDIIYPDDYVEKMIQQIEFNHRAFIITNHGRKFNHSPVKSYYNSAEIKINCIKENNTSLFLDVPGTGVMAYHTDTIKFKLSDFEISNMADIWAAKKAKKQGVEILCIKHPARWIRFSKRVNLEKSIYYNMHMKDQVQTNIVNSFL